MALFVAIITKRMMAKQVGGKDVIQEISYEYSDPDIGPNPYGSCVRITELSADGQTVLDDPSNPNKPDDGVLDLAAEGFIDAPTERDLVDFVIATNKSRPGAGEHANAHEYIANVCLAEANVPEAEEEMKDYVVPRAAASA